MSLSPLASMDNHYTRPTTSRTLKFFGAIEVAYHRFVSGEIETLPFKGPVVNLHLSAPHRLVQRQNGRMQERPVDTNDVAMMPAGTPRY